MSTTRRHTATLAASLLAGTLALGGCGGRTPPDDAATSVPQEQAAHAQTKAERLAALAEHLTAHNLHTGIPRVNASPPRQAGRGSPQYVAE